MARSKASSGRLDDAARAGWLYYVAGRTQDEIATAMGISRQTAQRLVSLAVSEKLVRVWLEHPIARCLEVASALERRFGLAREGKIKEFTGISDPYEAPQTPEL